VIGLPQVLLCSAALFCLGFGVVLLRRNAILMLVGIEFMLAAANLNLVAFWRFGEDPGSLAGPVFVLFNIAVAAAEAAVGLALILLIYRHRRTIDPAQFNLEDDHA